MLMMPFLWISAPCRLLDRCHRFGELYWPPSKGLKMTVGLSEMLSSTDKHTQRKNPEVQHHYKVRMMEVALYCTGIQRRTTLTDCRKQRYGLWLYCITVI